MTRFAWMEGTEMDTTCQRDEGPMGASVVMACHRDSDSIGHPVDVALIRKAA